MVDRITKSEFLAAFRSNLDDQGPIQVDLNKLSDQDWATLTEAGVNRTVLEEKAGADGVLKGEEFDAVWHQVVDALDENHDSFSIAPTVRNATTGLDEPSPARRVISVLEENREAAQRTHVHKFLERFEQGEFDLAGLGPDKEAQLAALGMPPPLLRRLAAGDNTIAGRRALGSLYHLIDRLDENRTAKSYDRTEAIPLEAEPTEEELADSGKAERILEGLFRAFEQPFRTYTDLVRGRRTPEGERMPAVSLNVAHVTQWNGTACFKAARKERIDFLGDTGRRVVDGADAHYMGRAENSRGQLTGRTKDFERGLQYIDYCLDNNRPITIGLSHKDAAYNSDRITDHALNIIGRDYDDAGRLYYTFNNPATSGEHKTGRLYVDDATGMLFRPAIRPGSTVVALKEYQVSRVTPYTDPGFTFEEVTGHPVTAPSLR